MANFSASCLLSVFIAVVTGVRAWTISQWGRSCDCGLGLGKFLSAFDKVASMGPQLYAADLAL